MRCRCECYDRIEIRSGGSCDTRRAVYLLACLFKFQNSLLAGDSTRFGDEENQERLSK